MMPSLGIIEGYYGPPWSVADRRNVIGFLAPHGYRFFIYAPKADAFLRKRWREPHPAEDHAELHALSQFCRARGVRFGVGLSPFEIYRSFDDDAQAALAGKLKHLDEIGLDTLAILFDDMRGDLPELARTQARIVEWAAERTVAKHIIVCPSYYTDDPILDRFFGQRPEGYLEELGSLLDPAIDFFWTGEEVCSREYSPGHLSRVSEQMKRKPFLWDNYPVNDGQRMSQHLHVRAFTGRPAAIGPHLAAHAVNPALQPTLSCIPALTLVESYAKGDAYEYGAAFRHAADAVAGPELAKLLYQDVLALQDVGLGNLGKGADRLRKRYTDIDHPAAREIIAWLDGAYRFKDEDIA
ncbi:MAG: hyaluronidase [Alphaproteobacteria bacterium]|nr:hyaluronidase [Alphaproteobacteria bacterium]